MEKTPLVQNYKAQKGLFYCFKDGNLENQVTLKIRSSSPKSYELLILPQ